MLLLAGLPLRKATGTALAVIPLVALTAVLADLITLPGNLRYDLGLAVALGGPLGVRIGRSVERRLPVAALKLLFQLLLLLTALRSLGILGELPSGALSGLAGGNPYLEWAYSGLLGIAAGFCAILFGVGGGVVVVPGLLFLVGHVDFRAATAASLFAMIPTTLLSLRVAARDGRLERALVPGLLLGAVPAVMVAVWLRNVWMEPQALTVLFGLFLLFVAVKMGFSRPLGSGRNPRSPGRS
jgi:uncharacterized membrane protein YfcA